MRGHTCMFDHSFLKYHICPMYWHIKAVPHHRTLSEKPNFEFYTDEQKVEYLLSDENNKDIPQMIEKCMEFRVGLLKALEDGKVNIFEWMAILILIASYLPAMLFCFSLSLI